jgi:FkbM family methyltransferase
MNSQKQRLPSDQRSPRERSAKGIIEVNLHGAKISIDASGPYSEFWNDVNNGKWEPNTLAIIDRLLKSGGTYIDVGAWIGPTVLKAAQQATRVIAYEPDPVAQAELRRNVALNGLSNVEVRAVALFDKSGTMDFGGGIANELGKSVSSLMHGARGIEVEVRDIAKEVQSPDFEQCQLLKIDVEGAEYRLIQRMHPYLERVKPPILLSTHSRKITGRSGIKGCFLQMADLSLLVRLLNIYRFTYIETRHGWQRFSVLQKIRYILSPRRNRQLLALDKAVDFTKTS